MKDKVYQEEKGRRTVSVFADRRAVEVYVADDGESSKTRYSVEQRGNQFYLSIVRVKQEEAARFNTQILGAENISKALGIAIEDIAEREKEADIKSLKQKLLEALSKKEEEARIR